MPADPYEISHDLGDPHGSHSSPERMDELRDLADRRKAEAALRPPISEHTKVFSVKNTDYWSKLTIKKIVEDAALDL